MHPVACSGKRLVKAQVISLIRYIWRTIYISAHINYNIRIKKCQEIIDKNYLQDRGKQI